MNAKQKAAESAENREQMDRHTREIAELEQKFRDKAAGLEQQRKRERSDLDFKQLKETFQLRAKYGHELGTAGRAILDGTFKRGRR